VTARFLVQLSPRAFPSRHCILIGFIYGTGSFSVRAPVCEAWNKTESLLLDRRQRFQSPFCTRQNLHFLAFSAPRNRRAASTTRLNSMRAAASNVSRDGQLPLIRCAHLSFHSRRRFCFTMPLQHATALADVAAISLGDASTSVLRDATLGSSDRFFHEAEIKTRTSS